VSPFSIPRKTWAPLFRGTSAPVLQDSSPDSSKEAGASTNIISAIPKKNRLPDVKRHRISESKMADSTSDKDFYSAMVNDVDRVVTDARKRSYDITQVVSARRFYWRKQTGYTALSFREAWKRVLEKLNLQEYLDKRSSTVMETMLSITGPDDESNTVEVNTSQGDAPDPESNRWAHLWQRSAALFEFGDWDANDK
jgi:hypothetical protein